VVKEGQLASSSGSIGSSSSPNLGAAIIASSKSEKLEKAEKHEKAEKLEKHEKVEKHEKTDKAEKAEKPEKTEKPEKIEKSEKGEKGEKGEKTEKAEKSIPVFRRMIKLTILGTTEKLREFLNYFKERDHIVIGRGGREWFGFFFFFFFVIGDLVNLQSGDTLVKVNPYAFTKQSRFYSKLLLNDPGLIIYTSFEDFARYAFFLPSVFSFLYFAFFLYITLTC
jgi:hypothetical protein